MEGYFLRQLGRKKTMEAVQLDPLFVSKSCARGDTDWIFGNISSLGELSSIGCAAKCLSHQTWRYLKYVHVSCLSDIVWWCT